MEKLVKFNNNSLLYDFCLSRAGEIDETIDMIDRAIDDDRTPANRIDQLVELRNQLNLVRIQFEQIANETESAMLEFEYDEAIAR